MRLNRQGPSEMRNAAAESGAADRESKPNRRPRSSFTLTRIKKLEREAPTEFIPLGKPVQPHRDTRKNIRIKKDLSEGWRP